MASSKPRKLNLEFMTWTIIRAGRTLYLFLLIYILLPALSLFALYLIFLEWFLGLHLIPWWPVVESVESGGIAATALGLYGGFGLFLLLTWMMMPDEDEEQVMRHTMLDKRELTDLRAEFEGKLTHDILTPEAIEKTQEPSDEDCLASRIQLSLADLNRLGEKLAHMVPFEKNEKIGRIFHIYALTRLAGSERHFTKFGIAGTPALDFIVTSKRILFAEHPIGRVRTGLFSRRIIAYHDCYVKPVVASMELSDVHRIHNHGYGTVDIQDAGQELSLWGPHFETSELVQTMGLAQRTDVCNELRCDTCDPSWHCEAHMRPHVMYEPSGSWPAQTYGLREEYIGFARARAVWLERMRELERR